jgi:hypothetical protein
MWIFVSRTLSGPLRQAFGASRQGCPASKELGREDELMKKIDDILDPVIERDPAKIDIFHARA